MYDGHGLKPLFLMLKQSLLCSKDDTFVVNIDIFTCTPSIKLYQIRRLFHLSFSQFTYVYCDRLVYLIDRLTCSGHDIDLFI